MTFNTELRRWLIHEDESLAEALQMIESNKSGLVFVHQSSGKVVGSLADGDIRRKLIDGVSLNSRIGESCNRSFVRANSGTDREKLLKLFDKKIRVVPILDTSGYLVDVVRRDSMPAPAEVPVYVRSRAPVRVSFGGGGSDLTYFFDDHNDRGGAVLNATVSLFSHATLRVRPDKRIYIYSQDLDRVLEADDLEVAINSKSDLGLVQAILKTVKPEFGFHLYLHSDFPIGSGLGGSASLTATILGCFNQLRTDKWDQYEIAELAYQAERIYLNVNGGWQDQYAAVFGGVNFMEFTGKRNIVHPLRIASETLRDLEESLLLFDTGIPHRSNDIHDDQENQFKASGNDELVKENVRLTYAMRDYLLRGDLMQFGKGLNLSWELKKQFSKKISSSALDKIYETAIKSGALGGKLLGAGGGGFFLFFVPPFQRFSVVKNLERLGVSARPFRFEKEGLTAWLGRETELEFSEQRMDDEI